MSLVLLARVMGTSVSELEDTYVRWLARTDDQVRTTLDTYDAAACLGPEWGREAAGTPMRMRGLEPPRGFPHTDLNRARLPIPPHPRGREW